MATKATLQAFILSFLAFASYAQTITLNANATSNNGTGGIFLRLTTTTNGINVSKFNTHFGSASGSAVAVEVYTRDGDYAGLTGSSTGWTLVGTVNTTSAGTATPAPIDVAALGISVAAGSVKSVYLQSITSGGGIRYFGTGTTSVTTFSDANVELFSNNARVTTVAFAGSLFTPRAFTGTIEYEVISATPVTWLSLAAKNINSTAQISWVVEEHNVEKYELEKQTVSGYKSVAAIVSKGNGTNTYTLVDASPFEATATNVVYRVKQKDLDGKVSYSSTILLKKAAGRLQLNIYPNPFTDKLQINSDSKQQVNITNSFGQVIIQVQLNAGNNTVRTSDWLPGIYFLKTEAGETMKIIK